MTAILFLAGGVFFAFMAHDGFENRRGAFWTFLPMVYSAYCFATYASMVL